MTRSESLTVHFLILLLWIYVLDPFLILLFRVRNQVYSTRMRFCSCLDCWFLLFHRSAMGIGRNFILFYSRVFHFVSFISQTVHWMILSNWQGAAFSFTPLLWIVQTQIFCSKVLIFFTGISKMLYLISTLF